MVRPLARFTLPAVVLLASACGVSQGLYQDARNQLERCESDSAAYRTASGRRLTELSRERETLLQRNEELRADHLRDQQEMGQLATNLTTTRRDLGDLRHARDLAVTRNRAYGALVARLQAEKLVAVGGLVAEVRRGRLILRLPGDLLFDGQEVALRGAGQQVLRRVAAALKELVDRDILVAAHTDNAAPWRRGAGGEAPRFGSNWELSAARAVAVVQFLQASGVDPRRLTAAGRSEFDPLADVRGEEGAARNRRVEIVILPDVEELPRLDDVRADSQ